MYAQKAYEAFAVAKNDATTWDELAQEDRDAWTASTGALLAVLVERTEQYGPAVQALLWAMQQGDS